MQSRGVVHIETTCIDRSSFYLTLWFCKICCTIRLFNFFYPSTWSWRRLQPTSRILRATSTMLPQTRNDTYVCCNCGVPNLHATDPECVNCHHPPCEYCQTGGVSQLATAFDLMPLRSSDVHYLSHNRLVQWITALLISRKRHETNCHQWFSIEILARESFAIASRTSRKQAPLTLKAEMERFDMTDRSSSGQDLPCFFWAYMPILLIEYIWASSFLPIVVIITWSISALF